MPAPHPRMHGLTHVRGGPDPVPCCVDPSGTSYPDMVQAHPCLVHYWPCDETSGDLIDRVGSWDLADTTSGGYPQYAAAGPFPELPELTAVVNAGTPGPSGSPSRFSGSGDATALWGVGLPYSIELWIYVDAYNPGGTSQLLEAGTGISGTELISVYLFGGEKLTMQYTGGIVVEDPDDLPLDTWHHVVLSFDGATMSLYRNGALLDTGSHPGDDVTGTMSFLNKQASDWNPLVGRGCQLALYDCALSAGEVAQHYAAQDATGDAPVSYVLTSDGAGSFSWEPPTIEVEY